MAVNFKTDQNYGYSLLPYFGVSPSLITQCKLVGVKISQNVPGTFLILSSEGTLCGSVTVKGTAISLAKAGNLGPASKASLQAQFDSCLKSALQKSKTLDPLPQAVPSFKTNEKSPAPLKSGVIDVDFGIIPSPKKKAHDAVKAMFNDLSNQAPHKKAPAVKLIDATELYQPVHGTSKNSTYYVLAMWPTLNLAGRFFNGRASFRVEGEGMKANSEALAYMGFNVSTNYASVHFEIGDTPLILTTFGAIVGRLGITSVVSCGTPEKVLGL